jgi:hypothetical protein
MKIISALIGVFALSSIAPVFAQLPSPVSPIPKLPSTPTLPGNINPNLNQNPGILQGDTTQMRSWVCGKQSDRIAVAAKEEKGWKTYIEEQGWQCTEENADIPDRTPSFSCEPAQELGILSVYWLAGRNGKKQLASWQKDLEQQQGTACTANNVQFFDTQNNIVPNLNR